MENIKCLIIGGGPAGYTAAIYAARAGLSPVLYEGLQPGGQLTTTTLVENYPGFSEGVQGPQLMDDMRTQALRLGTDIRLGTVTQVDFSSRPFVVKADEAHEIQARSVIIATGAAAKYLGLESENRFRGMGVSACATCDGFFYRGKDVAVVGGGDSACEEAVYLASICRKVYMVIRKPYFAASQAMQRKVASTSNIEVIFRHNTQEILGDDTGVTGMLLKGEDGQMRTIDVHGVFMAIGHTPNTEIFRGQIELDDKGYIVTRGVTSHTSVEGVFAAGDVQDSRYRQAVTSAASGCKAALDCERYLNLMQG